MMRAGAFVMLCLMLPLAVAGAVHTVDRTGQISQLTFDTYDVILECGDHRLGAYQVGLHAVRGTVRLVGVEGGDPSPYAHPPFYDPRALARDRVIIGAFSTASDLPTGDVRVARLHVEAHTTPVPEFEVFQVIAGDGTGVRFDVRVRIERVANPDGEVE